MLLYQCTLTLVSDSVDVTVSFGMFMCSVFGSRDRGDRGTHSCVTSGYLAPS